jgi:hypothetical protein
MLRKILKCLEILKIGKPRRRDCRCARGQPPNLSNYPHDFFCRAGGRRCRPRFRIAYRNGASGDHALPDEIDPEVGRDLRTRRRSTTHAPAFHFECSINYAPFNVDSFSTAEKRIVCLFEHGAGPLVVARGHIDGNAVRIFNFKSALCNILDLDGLFAAQAVGKYLIPHIQ